MARIFSQCHRCALWCHMMGGWKAAFCTWMPFIGIHHSFMSCHSLSNAQHLPGRKPQRKGYENEFAAAKGPGNTSLSCRWGRLGFPWQSTVFWLNMIALRTHGARIPAFASEAAAVRARSWMDVSDASAPRSYLRIWRPRTDELSFMFNKTKHEHQVWQKNAKDILLRWIPRAMAKAGLLGCLKRVFV